MTPFKRHTQEYRHSRCLHLTKPRTTSRTELTACGVKNIMMTVATLVARLNAVSRVPVEKRVSFLDKNRIRPRTLLR